MDDHVSMSFVIAASASQQSLKGLSGSCGIHTNGGKFGPPADGVLPLSTFKHCSKYLIPAQQPLWLLSVRPCIVDIAVHCAGQSDQGPPSCDPTSVLLPALLQPRAAVLHHVDIAQRDVSLSSLTFSAGVLTQVEGVSEVGA